MEALHSGGSQSLDFNILTAASTGDVVGNDQRYADVHAIMLDAGGSATAAAHKPGVTKEAAGEGTDAQDAASSASLIVLGAKAKAGGSGTTTTGSYVGQTLRVYDYSQRGLKAANSLTGSNAPHGPKGYSDFPIIEYTVATNLCKVTGALPWNTASGGPGASKAANDEDSDWGIADVFDVDYEILPGIKVTGTGNIVAIVARLHVPQV
jgi:hypothetical protein